MTMLKPRPMPALPAGLICRVAAYNGSFLTPRSTPVKTLADLLDYALDAMVECDCKRSVTVVPPDRFLALKEPVPEDTPIRDLAHWLTCRDCGGKTGVSVRAGTFSNTSLVPRKGFLENGIYRPAASYVPVPPLEHPAAPSSERPRRRHPSGRRHA